MLEILRAHKTLSRWVSLHTDPSRRPERRQTLPHFPAEKQAPNQTKPCNDTEISAVRSTVAAVCCSTTRGGNQHTTHTYEVCKPPSPNYTWHLTHAAWNLLRRIEQGNTTTAPKDAHALRSGDKIAVWWEEPDSAVPACWYTAKVVDTTIERSAQHTVRYDQDKKIYK